MRTRKGAWRELWDEVWTQVGHKISSYLSTAEWWKASGTCKGMPLVSLSLIRSSTSSAHNSLLVLPLYTCSSNDRAFIVPAFLQVRRDHIFLKPRNLFALCWLVRHWSRARVLNLRLDYLPIYYTEDLIGWEDHELASLEARDVVDRAAGLTCLRASAYLSYTLHFDTIVHWLPWTLNHGSVLMRYIEGVLAEVV